MGSLYTSVFTHCDADRGMKKGRMEGYKDRNSPMMNGGVPELAVFWGKAERKETKRQKGGEKLLSGADSKRKS